MLPSNITAPRVRSSSRSSRVGNPEDSTWESVEVEALPAFGSETDCALAPCRSAHRTAAIATAIMAAETARSAAVILHAQAVIGVFMVHTPIMENVETTTMRLISSTIYPAGIRSLMEKHWETFAG